MERGTNHRTSTNRWIHTERGTNRHTSVCTYIGAKRGEGDISTTRQWRRGLTTAHPQTDGETQRGGLTATHLYAYIHTQVEGGGRTSTTTHQMFPYLAKLHRMVNDQDQIWPRTKIRNEILHLHATFRLNPRK